MAAELNEATGKLVVWLQEAHAKEAELEGALTSHIGMTDKQAYKKHLQTHLKETRDHKRRVTSRVKQLGGSLDGSLSDAVVELAGKTIAVAKGPIDALRAAVTRQAETHLRNAEEELREEHAEIALYSRIEAFATEVGDRETARLAASIRRDEERMAKYLDGELVRLVKELVRAEIPREQRAGRSRSSKSKSTASGSSGRSRSTASGRSRRRPAATTS